MYLGVQVGRRGDLDDLLVAPLDRAVALEEVNHVAVVVAQDLHLDVARPLDELLDKHPAVPERLLGLVRGANERVLELALTADHADAPAASAHRRLQDDREAGLGGKLVGRLHFKEGLVGAGNHGHTTLDGQLAGGRLVAHGCDGLVPWGAEEWAATGA